MRILPNTRTHRGETPFRHGFLVGDLPMADDLFGGSFVLALDVIDPIGATVPVPGRPNSLIAFDDPTVAVCLLRRFEETGRKRPMMMPTSLLDALRAEARALADQIQDIFLAEGAAPNAAARVALSVESALLGATHRPDHYGVKMWSPHLDLPFGVVLAGPWIATPPEADAIPAPAQPSASEASA